MVTAISSQATRVGLALFEYDFATHGGAIGTIVIGANRLPIGAIVLDGIIHVKTAPTSGDAATVALHVMTSEDILAATAIATLTLNSLHDTVCVGTAATAIRCTSAKGLSFVIGAYTLTAGNIVVGLRYIDTA